MKVVTKAALALFTKERRLSIRKIKAIGTLAVLLALCNCTPTLHLQVERPPNWNTAGLKRIAIMPFEGDRDLANHLTQDAIARVTRTGHFTVVSSSEVERLRRSGESLANHIDVVLTGKIMNTQSSGIQTHTSQVKNKDGTTSTLTYYTLEVSLEISYSLERTRDGSLVGTTRRTETARSQAPERSGLQSVAQLLRQCNVLRSLGADLAPHTVNEQRQLMADKTKNKTLNEEMKSATAFVNQRNYRAALSAYLKIYEQHGSFAAAYNAAMMHEALRDVNAALELMQEADSRTGHPVAKSEIERLSKYIQTKEVIQTEHKAAVRPIDRVCGHASNETLNHLSDGAKVWFVNNSGNERDLANTVVDNMTAMLINNGVTVVDRENTKLIEQELLQQFSGSVNDEDILNAGRLAGANTIITIAIEGVGSMRRLRMRVLDVERGVPLLQSDSGSNWEL